MTQRVLFRADSRIGMGSGHVVRCMALARKFARRSAGIAFLCRDKPGALLNMPQQEKFALARQRAVI